MATYRQRIVVVFGPAAVVLCVLYASDAPARLRGWIGLQPVRDKGIPTDDRRDQQPPSVHPRSQSSGVPQSETPSSPAPVPPQSAAAPPNRGEPRAAAEAVVDQRATGQARGDPNRWGQGFSKHPPGAPAASGAKRHTPTGHDPEWNGPGTDSAAPETRLTLDLTQRFQRIPLAAAADVAWERARVVLAGWSGTQVAARWQPLSGEVTRSRPLHVLFEQAPQVRLHISLESWQGQTTVRVAPQLQLPNGQVTDWGLSRGTKLHRRALQRATRLQMKMHDAEREYRQILVWFATRSTKRIADRAAAKARLVSMREEVPQLAVAWTRAQHEAEALAEIVALGQQLHGLAELSFSTRELNRFAAVPE